MLGANPSPHWFKAMGATEYPKKAENRGHGRQLKKTMVTQGDQQMKIKITEIEANAEEIRQSNTLADGLTRLFRNMLNPYYSTPDNDDKNEGEE